MGYRARWLAVKNATLPTVLSTLGLELQAATNEAVYDPGHFAVTMPGGWLVVMGDGWDAMDSVLPEHARALSTGTDALHFFCDDSSMCASLTAWREGQQRWSLTHDASDGPATPVLSGAPPAVVGEVLARCEAQRAAGAADVDFLYDAAAQIAHALVGFRHDETLASGEVRPILLLAPVR